VGEEALGEVLDGLGEGGIGHLEDEKSAFGATSRTLKSLERQTLSGIATRTAGRAQQARAQRQSQAPQVGPLTADTPPPPLMCKTFDTWRRCPG